MTDRLCAWCAGPIRPRARRDAIYCRTLCRQAAHRFASGRRSRGAAPTVMRFGYADPPYPKLAARYYADHPDFAGEVDHAALIARLVDTYPDGWALSTSAVNLQTILALCPSGVRVAAWVRGERPAAHLTPLSAWEPVIVAGGRERLTGPGEARRTDALVYHARARLTDPRRVTGAKPSEFAYWLFDLLGALPGDELDDLFPGSGGIARAWTIYNGTTSSFSASSEVPKAELPPVTVPSRVDRPRLLEAAR